jgi:hypothetical protein
LVHKQGAGQLLSRVYYRYNGQNVWSRLTSVTAYAENDIWVGSNQPEHWNGVTWQQYDLTSTTWNGWINKIWGNKSDNIYMVGAGGTIAHYDGDTWSKQESGTDIDLLDVYGSPDASVVWACGYLRCCLGTCLLRNTGTGWQVSYEGTSTELQILADSISGAYTGLFTTDAKRICIGSSAGIYIAPTVTHGEGKRASFTSNSFPGFPEKMRGNGFNDLTIVGDFNFIAHYNGITWRHYSEFSDPNAVLYSVDQRGNFVVAAGTTTDPINGKGIVFRGRR